ncbi:molybdopterin-guanine dinucleotide biosynthesis protein B [Photobacterium makurazakiensis]|uniref:molybdopterin-guanine dinucleotide biosynthesis protein B n=1 Tax=Photobacterium makurazakiensis TaxID=2910234 RepID=UPI003D0B4D3B
MTPILGFAGYSGSGKTTLLELLIPILKQHGLRIGLIKHSHHSIDPDKPGKDSYRLRHAGCAQTLLATKERHVLYFEYPEPEREEPELQACIDQLDHRQLDLIIVEGFREENIPKIEVHRPSYGKPLLHPIDSFIIAFATDGEHLNNCAIPQLDLNQPTEIAAFIQHWLKSVNNDNA